MSKDNYDRLEVDVTELEVKVSDHRTNEADTVDVKIEEIKAQYGDNFTRFTIEMNPNHFPRFSMEATVEREYRVARAIRVFIDALTSIGKELK